MGVRICDELDDRFVSDGLELGWLIDAGTAGRLDVTLDEDDLYGLPEPEYRAIVDALQDLLAHPRRGIDVWMWRQDFLRRTWRVRMAGVPSITSLPERP